MKTGLQYVGGGYDDIPCVVALKVMGQYSKEIRKWIWEALAIEGEDEAIGGLDWGLNAHSEL